jgi:hypothetical protein
VALPGPGRVSRCFTRAEVEDECSLARIVIWTIHGKSMVKCPT